MKDEIKNYTNYLIDKIFDDSEYFNLNMDYDKINRILKYNIEYKLPTKIETIDTIINIDKDDKLKQEFEKQEFEKQEFEKCKKDIIYFAENYIKLSSNKLIKLNEKQINLFNNLVKNNADVEIVGRQIGKTTACLIYALYLALFNRKQNQICIFTPYDLNIKDILSKIKQMNDCLPSFLKGEIKKDTYHSIEFKNNSIIYCFRPYTNEYRGTFTNTIIFDDCFIASQLNNDELIDITEKMLCIPYGKIIKTFDCHEYNTFLINRNFTNDLENKFTSNIYNPYNYYTKEIILNDISNLEYKYKIKIEQVKFDDCYNNVFIFYLINGVKFAQHYHINLK